MKPETTAETTAPSSPPPSGPIPAPVQIQKPSTIQPTTVVTRSPPSTAAPRSHSSRSRTTRAKTAYHSAVDIPSRLQRTRRLRDNHRRFPPPPVAREEPLPLSWLAEISPPPPLSPSRLEQFADFDIRETCSFETSWISQGCMNITTKA